MLDGKFEEMIPHDYVRLSSEEALSTLRSGGQLQRCSVRQLTLTGEVDYALLLREVYIRHLHIQNAKCETNLVLNGCHVRRLIVENSEFQESVNLKHSKIHFIHVKSCHFSKSLNAPSVEVSSKTVIQDSVFEGRVRFWEAHIKDWFTFNQCSFQSKVDLRSTIFEGGFTAPGCSFEDEFLFRGAHLALKWEAPEAHFNALVDFSKAKLNDFVYLEEVTQGDQQEWAFWNTVSDRILIRPDQVEGRLQSEEQGDYPKAMREYLSSRETLRGKSV